MKPRVLALISIFLIALSVPGGINNWCVAQTTHEEYPMGYTDTPMLPGGKWHVHDINRPQPARVRAPACGVQTTADRPPSDAEVLFDGRDLSKWRTAKAGDAAWSVRDGYMEVVPHSGDIYTREVFGPIQVHVEWRTPAPLKPGHIYQGNSGVFLHGVYELQVFESSVDLIYADGQAGAIYGQYPPLVNSSCAPGEWQTFDVAFTPARFQDGKLLAPAYITAFQNGVLIQNYTAIMGDTGHRIFPRYIDHSPQGPIRLQDHGDLVRFRNIWVRRLGVSPFEPAS